MNYGIEPEIVGEFFTPECELTYVLYMPVMLADGQGAIPKHLMEYAPLVHHCLGFEEFHHGSVKGKYAYLTVKRLWVEPGCLGGRPGWHTDGFGTDDVNYIWSDTDPTDFCIQPFNLSDDHAISMRQMDDQARHENIRTYGALNILRLDARHVHRCPVDVTPGYRTFARVSISADRYDMIGNARNHDLDYNWIMHPRGAVRNDVSARRG